jgi:hypothetical protein
MNIRFLAVASCWALFGGSIAPAASAPTPAPTLWGSNSHGLQCGLRMHSSSLPTRQTIELTVKNAGSSTLVFDNNALHAIASGFSLENENGSAPKTGRIYMVAGSEIYVVGQRNTSAVPAGQSLVRAYQINLDPSEVPGAFTVTFHGLLEPDGAKTPIPLTCGPLAFSV